MENHKNFNVTRPILVKLTEEGMKTYRERISSVSLEEVTEEELNDHIAQNTTDGYLKIPLYIFSHIFGPTMIGKEHPPHFKCDILIPENMLTPSI